MPVETSNTSGAGWGSNRILIVDDDALLRRTLTRFLKREGFRVSEAADGEEAWEFLQEHEVDVIITDVKMPRRTGIELLESLREEQSGIPVILITGAPNVEAAVDCMKIGAFDYISKPVKPVRLRERVQAALSYRRSQLQGVALGTGPGDVLAGYRIIRVLGEGNGGVVCQVEKDTPDGLETYAVKILKAAGLEGDRRERMQQRFLHEAKAASRISHPNVIRFVEYGLARAENIPYLVMEYFSSPTLKEILQTLLRRNVADKIRIVRQIASALAAIHAEGICHRDVKPGNVMVDPDTLLAKISDFGVAQLPESDLTVGSHLLGSPAYMAPEAFACARVDRRADIFSLGVLAYELFLGERPFWGQSVPLLAKQIPGMRPKAPRKLDPDFPEELQVILARMLRKKPAQRYDSATELVGDFDSFTRGELMRTSVWQRFTKSFSPDWE